MSFGPLVLYVEWFYFPILDGHMMFLEFMYNDGLIDRYGDYLQQEIINENIVIDEFYTALVSMFVVVLGPIFLIFPIIIVLPYLISLSYWICKKTHILPILQLVVIRNGKGTTILRFKQ